MFRRICFAQARSILFTQSPANNSAPSFAASSSSSSSSSATSSSSSCSPSSSYSVRSSLSAVCLDYGQVRVGVASLPTACTFAVPRGIIQRAPSPGNSPSHAAFPLAEQCHLTDFVFKSIFRGDLVVMGLPLPMRSGGSCLAVNASFDMLMALEFGYTSWCSARQLPPPPSLSVPLLLIDERLSSSAASAALASAHVLPTSTSSRQHNARSKRSVIGHKSSKNQHDTFAISNTAAIGQRSVDAASAAWILDTAVRGIISAKSQLL